MNVTIEINNKRFSVDEEVAQHIFCLRQQISTLTKALDMASKPAPSSEVRPFKAPKK